MSILIRGILASTAFLLILTLDYDYDYDSYDDYRQEAGAAAATRASARDEHGGVIGASQHGQSGGSGKHRTSFA
jgi:hypothetical protein